jgi:hypothetical protein
MWVPLVKFEHWNEAPRCGIRQWAAVVRTKLLACRTACVLGCGVHVVPSHNPQINLNVEDCMKWGEKRHADRDTAAIIVQIVRANKHSTNLSAGIARLAQVAASVALNCEQGAIIDVWIEV